ncbi:hypothetical protein OS493_036864 [Desmophyllum pertusum]|uniref:Uncharacterized protein n=1 Tax=Desmophyllum pertusum TaxID=174260 RepID=A0A9W9Z700_9CNID|nr:hypothetical protein OS493_036864 [Desmophyllum pertusum]
MDRKMLVVFGIVTLLTLAVLLTHGQKTRRGKYRWVSRRMIRQRPTKSMTASSSHAQIQPVGSAAQNNQNDSGSGQQDFKSPEDAQEYWKNMYENGDVSQPSEPGF